MDELRPKPALKHGGYSTTTLLPGENRSEFEKLYKDLITEHCPNGALEQDIVLTIAHLIWRKHHIATLRKAVLRTWDDSGTKILFATVEEAAADRLMRDLDVQARIDSEVERCVKRLLLLKGLKSLPATSSSTPSQFPVPSDGRDAEI
jgi:hypothetical protein